MYKEWLLVDARWQEQSGVLCKRYPTLTSEIIMELFLSKGHFHRYWNKLFSPLSHYPVLEAWFNREPSTLAPTSIEAWGSSKNKPKFADLEKCLTDLGATWGGTKFVPLHSNLDSSSSSSQSTHNTHYMSSNDKKKKKKKKNFILCLLLFSRVGDSKDKLYTKKELKTRTKQPESSDSNRQEVKLLAEKMDQLAKHLDFVLYKNTGEFEGTLSPLNPQALQPLLVACPLTYECVTAIYIPKVQVLQANAVNPHGAVVNGQCNHEVTSLAGSQTRCYLNSARYLKLGSNIWGTGSLLAVFHASTEAITAYWNLSFGNVSGGLGPQVGRHHIWQAFVQESLRMIGGDCQSNLTIANSLPISQVTTAAYEAFGREGVISVADDHSCPECTHTYKDRPDALDMEEVPMEVDGAPTVNMVVVDGVVFGPTHCAFDECSEALANYRGASFCTPHKEQWGSQCHVIECGRAVVDGTKACVEHQVLWRKWQKEHSHTWLSGVRRALQRPEETCRGSVISVGVQDANWMKLNAILGLASEEHSQLGLALWFDKTSWVREDVTIDVPFDQSAKVPGRKPFTIPNFYPQPLLSVITAKLKDAEAQKSFHILPFDLRWQPDNQKEDIGVYSELYTPISFAHAHQDLMDLPPKPDCQPLHHIMALMFASDATQLATFGTTDLWPVYMFVGNKSTYQHCKPTMKIGKQVAYLEKLPDNLKDFIHANAGKDWPKDQYVKLTTHCKRELCHAQWNIMLDDNFLAAYQHGIVVKWCDGIERRFYPRIFTYSADYPEKSIDFLTAFMLLIVYSQEHLSQQSGKWVNVLAPDALSPETSFVKWVQFMIWNSDRSRFNVFGVICTDILHESELGVWKAILIQLLHLLQVMNGTQTSTFDMCALFLYLIGLAKLQMHTNQTLELLKEWMTLLGQAVCDFEQSPCKDYKTQELKKELQTCQCQEAKQVAQKGATTGISHQRQKSVDPCSQKQSTATKRKTTGDDDRDSKHVKHRKVAPDYPNVQDREDSPADLREADVDQDVGADVIVNTETGAADKKEKTLSLSTYVFHSLGDMLNSIKLWGTTDSYSTQIISEVQLSKNKPEESSNANVLHSNETESFLLKLKAHLLCIEQTGSSPTSPSVDQVSYTTYDVWQDQDTINPDTVQRDLMVLWEPNPDDGVTGHHFHYGCVLSVFHANIICTSAYIPTLVRLNKLWFLDLADVIRACHIMPRFSLGMVKNPEDPIDSCCTQDQLDWKEYYVNRFVDRDMVMHYHWGLGMGHRVEDMEPFPYLEEDSDGYISGSEGEEGPLFARQDGFETESDDRLKEAIFVQE
ncbi:hypothetical protein FA15DRAFT_661909 [Coprinopsis marcescibilis]|uniref:CxC6 like cysteine cluster associated with KDZ domain-containing protein n=1 Tax=Coprinopsis marcescibilis TaxID=230819 RepID=A0A5C3KAZ3_COPMA|nr:hypothetical protein FA15DRAFT_661909 [Coprinopsis marcescibilis]